MHDDFKRALSPKTKNNNKMKNLLTVVFVTKSITISDTKKMLEKRFENIMDVTYQWLTCGYTKPLYPVINTWFMDSDASVEL